MKRPLIMVALLYVAGILLAPIPVPLPVLFAIAFGLLIPALIWTRARLIFLCPLILMTGWINLAQRTTIVSPNDLRKVVGRQEALVEIRGVLRETPFHRVHKEKGVDVWNSMARIDAGEIRFEGGQWQPASGRVMAGTKGILPATLFAGQTVEVNGVIHPPKGPVAEGLFDYGAYLEEQGIYYQMRAQTAADWQVIHSPAGPPLADRFVTWGRKALAIGLPVEDETLRLEWALTLGAKEVMTDEVSEPFVRASTYHIFAVDGLRIAIVSGIFLVVLRVIGVPRAYCGLLVAPIIWFYAAMTGWPASAIRAIVMIMVVFGGLAMKRPDDFINSLFAAALVILAWEPRQLFQAGFQLSFFVVLCIILILPFFKVVEQRVEQKILRLDPLLPDELRPRWQHWLKIPVHYLLGLFFTSFAAWLGSIPLVAYYFHILTPVSGPANIPAVAFCGLVLIANLSSLLLAGWFPYAAGLFNNAGWLCMKIIQWTTHWSAIVPKAYFYVPVPSLFTIALYYLILLTVFTGWLWQGQWRRWKLGGIAVLSVGWCVHWLASQPVARLTILPLDGGHAVYVNSSKSHQDSLIDTGNEQSVEMVVKLFLQAQGVNRLDHFILTHGEIGYTGGAEMVSDLFPLRNIHASTVRFRSPEYLKFQTKMESTPAWRKPLQSGDVLGPWTVLHPAATNHFSKAADNALVLRGELGASRILLLSNLGRSGQNALLEQTNALRADIVVAGLPSDGEPLCDALLDAIQPQAIIIVDADFPAFRRAKRVLQDRLAGRHVPVIYTRNANAVTLEMRPKGWELTTMNGIRLSSQHLAMLEH